MTVKFGELTSAMLGMPASLSTAAALVSQPAPPAGTTPTVAQFLDAANEAYDDTGALGPPAGLTPFLVNGRQVTLLNEADGISARVWLTGQNQIVIAFEGTSTAPVDVVANPLLTLTQLLSSVGAFAGTTPASETDALAFTRQVIADAAQQGYSSSNIFVTGHSLGGIQASYVAQQTGLGGMAFESTGIPKSSTSVGNGSNFVSFVTYGDPVGNYASDVKGEQPLAPAYAPGQSGTLPHYGQVVMIGSPSAQAPLSSAAALEANPLLSAIGWGDLASLLLEYHLPGVQAHDLGVNLAPSSPLLWDSTGDLSGPVIPVANDTIPQLLGAYGHH